MGTSSVGSSSTHMNASIMPTAGRKRVIMGTRIGGKYSAEYALTGAAANTGAMAAAICGAVGIFVADNFTFEFTVCVTGANDHAAAKNVKTRTRCIILPIPPLEHDFNTSRVAVSLDKALIIGSGTSVPEHILALSSANPRNQKEGSSYR